MILSDRDIEDRLENGDLVIEPLDDPELQIQPASVDVRLGTEFLEFRNHGITCIHPDRPSEVRDYTQRQARLRDYQPDSEKNFRREMDEGDAYVLHPGDFVLGTTYERVEIPDDLVARVEGRSSLGRLAIVVHASLPADEQLYLWTPEDGFGFHAIGDVVADEPNARAVSFDPATLRVRTFPITDFITNPAQRIYSVTLTSGREVLVTRDHNLFTLDEEGAVTRLASEAAEDRLVMVPGSLPAPNAAEEQLDLLDLFPADDDDLVVYASDGLGAVDWDRVPSGSRRHYASRDSAPLPAIRRSAAPSDVDVAFKQSDARLPRHIDVTPEFGWMLGFYVAEGFARRKQLVFTNTERAHLERVADWFDRYGTSLSWHEADDGADQLTVCSALWAKVVGTLAGTGTEKTVPDRAWNWPDDVLEAFLQGLLDGDGHRRAERDTLYTANRELADRATYLGSRLGYATSTYHRERDNAAASDEWCVDFSENAHKRGQYVPNPSALLRTLREEAGLTMADAADAMGRSSKSSVSNVENEEYDAVKRETLRAFRDCYAEHGADVSRLDEILAEHVRFDRVVAVEETDRVETTYDLEVQPNGRHVENFLGGFGGVFLSNTAGFIDPGYEGQITLELSNLGEAPVALRPKEMRVSQLVFTELSSPARRPYGDERGSKYQDQAGPTASRIQDDDEWHGHEEPS